MTAVAIIGAGLAGCAVGYYLARAGCEVVVYEAAERIAAGASGNEVGMVNPRFSAFETAESLFYVDAFERAVALFETLGDVEWNPCGALHLITDEKRGKRYRQTVEHWDLDGLRVVDAAEASVIAGVDVPFEAMVLERSGSVSPRRLCEVLARDLDVRFGERVGDLDGLEADVVIVANGMGAAVLLDLPLKGVRGQITEVRGSAASRDLKVNLHYGGYFSAARAGGVHTIGATFQRWLDHTDILDEDDVYNVEKLSGFFPELAGGLEVVGHRGSLRTTAPDHFPVIGHVRDHIYVSSAHGSHGVISSIGGAQLLVDMIMKQDVGLSEETVEALCPRRFKDAKELG